MTTQTGVFSTKTGKSEKLLKIFGKSPKYPLTYFGDSYKLGTNSIAVRFFTVCFGKRIAIILLKPYKIRNMTMENLVIYLVGLVGLFAFFYVNCQMLKWVKRGGGGSFVEERQELKVKMVGSPTFFPQNSPLLLTLYGSALRWSNFLW
jgi:hypothetical protein